jgi:hypothetical protein
VGEVGEVQSGEEEGGVVSRGACCGEFAVGFVFGSGAQLSVLPSCWNRNIFQPVAAICDR